MGLDALVEALPLGYGVERQVGAAVEKLPDGGVGVGRAIAVGLGLKVVKPELQLIELRGRDGHAILAEDVESAP